MATPSPRAVVFTLANPLGGFLQALTQPIAPVHVLGDVPIDLLPDHPFGQQPIGSGPFSLVELTIDVGDAWRRPSSAPVEDEEATPDPAAPATDSLDHRAADPSTRAAAAVPGGHRPSASTPTRPSWPPTIAPASWTPSRASHRSSPRSSAPSPAAGCCATRARP